MHIPKLRPPVKRGSPADLWGPHIFRIKIPKSRPPKKKKKDET